MDVKFCVSLNELENVDKLGLTFLIINFINSLKIPSMCCEHTYVTNLPNFSNARVLPSHPL